MFGLTIVHFAAAGIQFLTISYMQVVLYMEPLQAQSSFIFVLFSAMVPGIILGSTLGDYFGGYEGKGMKNALALCVMFGAFASFFSISLSFVFTPHLFTLLLWLFFFCGAGCMPIANGIILGCVPKSAQNSASALNFVF